MKVCHVIAMTFTLSVSTAAFAANKPAALYKDGNCNNCHSMGSETTGPTFSPGPSLLQIADKYRDDKEAQGKLEQKVRNGGSGSWGVLPMPGTRSSISDEDINILVKWILEQKKAEPKTDKKYDTKTDKKTK